MERLLKAADLIQRYGCSATSARNYMRRMRHMENPLRVFESDLLEWERSRMKYPATSRATSGRLVVDRTR